MAYIECLSVRQGRSGIYRVSVCEPGEAIRGTGAHRSGIYRVSVCEPGEEWHI